MVFIMLGGTAKVGLMLFPNPEGLSIDRRYPFITIQTHRTSTGNQNRRTDASGNRSVKSPGSLGYGGQQST